LFCIQREPGSIAANASRTKMDSSGPLPNRSVCCDDGDRPWAAQQRHRPLGHFRRSPPNAGYLGFNKPGIGRQAIGAVVHQDGDTEALDRLDHR
jgi:hypothetical protein